MALAQYRLENSWHPLAESASGGFTFTLVNLSGAPLKDFRIVYTSLTRTVDKPVCGNAVYLRRNANFHEFAPPHGLRAGARQILALHRRWPAAARKASHGWREIRLCQPCRRNASRCRCR